MSRIEEALKKIEAARDNTRPALITVVGTPESDQTATVDDRVVAFHQPATGLAETFKQFNTVIRAIAQGSASTLAFTSACKGEGKSVVALNFAVSLAHDTEGTVCIVDGDLRNPSLHRLLGKRNTDGLVEMLEGKLSASNAALPTAVENLFYIPAGKLSANPSELFSSRRAAQVIAELRSSFDCVIFDTAPVLPVADTIHLGNLLDGTVFVVYAGKTPRKQVGRAVELMGNANVLGFILNKMEQEGIKSYP